MGPLWNQEKCVKKLSYVLLQQRGGGRGVNPDDFKVGGVDPKHNHTLLKSKKVNLISMNFLSAEFSTVLEKAQLLN